MSTSTLRRLCSSAAAAASQFSHNPQRTLTSSSLPSLSSLSSSLFPSPSPNSAPPSPQLHPSHLTLRRKPRTNRTFSTVPPSSKPQVACPSPAPGEVWMPSLGLYVPSQDKHVDAFRIVRDDLDTMTRSIRDTVSVLQHPSLDRAATHLLSLHGKRIRPIIVLLVAHAASIVNAKEAENTDNIIEPCQLRLAEITELIHAASLLHDDVIDVADKRRGTMSVNSMFGNQLAVLAGDFLLARASVALARLRDCEVVELLSTVIEHLVRGEVIQMKKDQTDSMNIHGGIGDVVSKQDNWYYHNSTNPFDIYLAKTFFKTASLIANSCRAVTMLVHHSSTVSDAAYEFGEGIGIAFQLIDDMLDLTAASSVLGKPVLNDMRQGVITAPILFAAEKFPQQVHPIIQRGCTTQPDIDLMLDLVHQADGLEKTRQLAQSHAQRAVHAIVNTFPPSPYRSALVNLADFVLRRQS